jgi:hypothetical protein
LRAPRLAVLAAYHPGPVYVRLTRPKTPVIYTLDEPFAIGGSKVIRESPADVATIVAAGITVFDHPGNIRHPSPWYLSEGPQMPYFSPALLFNDPLELAPRQSLKLTYRVVVHSRQVTASQIENHWKHFTAPAKP